MVPEQNPVASGPYRRWHVVVQPASLVQYDRSAAESAGDDATASRSPKPSPSATAAARAALPGMERVVLRLLPRVGRTRITAQDCGA